MNALTSHRILCNERSLTKAYCRFTHSGFGWHVSDTSSLLIDTMQQNSPFPGSAVFSVFVDSVAVISSSSILCILLCLATRFLQRSTNKYKGALRRRMREENRWHWGKKPNIHIEENEFISFALHYWI